MMRVVMEMRIPQDKMGMVIMMNSVVARTWHSHLPPRSIHTVVPHTPRFYKEINSSSLWIHILRYKLHTPPPKGRMGQRCLRDSRAS